MNIRKKLGYFFGKKNKAGFPVRYNSFGVQTERLPAFKEYDWSKVVNPITRKEVVQWIKALRSGEYAQTSQVLCTGDAYCCLGVKAKLDNTLVEGKSSETYSIYSFRQKDGTETMLRDGFAYYVLPQQMQLKYTVLNDNQDYTFNQIADELAKDFGIV